jgi:hypothetical protein
MSVSVANLPIVRLEDQIWYSEAFRINGIREMIREDLEKPSERKTFIVMFFDETLDNFLKALNAKERDIPVYENSFSVYNPEEITKNSVSFITSNLLNDADFTKYITKFNCRFIFAERHPLFSRELNALESIGQMGKKFEVVFCSDLDSIIIDNYVEDLILTKHKDFKPNTTTSISDKEVSKGISVAQKMLDEKVKNEKPAYSEVTWFYVNLGMRVHNNFQLPL